MLNSQARKSNACRARAMTRRCCNERCWVLARSVKGAMERTSYLPAQLQTNDEGLLLAHPLKWGGSSDFVAFARATALVIVPAGVHALDVGERVRVVRLPGGAIKNETSI